MALSFEKPVSTGCPLWKPGLAFAVLSFRVLPNSFYQAMPRKGDPERLLPSFTPELLQPTRRVQGTSKQLGFYQNGNWFCASESVPV